MELAWLFANKDRLATCLQRTWYTLFRLESFQSLFRLHGWCSCLFSITNADFKRDDKNATTKMKDRKRGTKTKEGLNMFGK